MSHDKMVKIAYERYEQFDEQRRGAEVLEADAQDIEELEQAERRLSKKKGGRDAS
jgi:hypothetical protein